MLESISWQQFINTGLYAIGGYYAISVPLLYHKDIILSLRRRDVAEASVRSDVSAGSMMGAIHQGDPLRKQTMASQNVFIASPPSKESFEAELHETLMSDKTLSDVFDEVDGLIKVVSHQQLDKPQAEAFLGNVFMKFSMLSDTQRESVNTYVIDEFQRISSIAMDASTLDRLWKEAE